ncbi:MAG: hypothetical protein JWP49_1734 [Phenylobacterium sp.]|nr:hypothetical protein [Phenylobacterium sp.]
MKLHTLAAACAAFVSLSATAALAAEPVTVKLQAPVAQPVKFIAGGAVFNCDGDTCVANATTSSTFGADTCKTVAAKVGAVSTFTGRKALDEARLAQCNIAAVASNTALAKR